MLRMPSNSVVAPGRGVNGFVERSFAARMSASKAGARGRAWIVAFFVVDEAHCGRGVCWPSPLSVNGRNSTALMASNNVDDGQCVFTVSELSLRWRRFETCVGDEPIRLDAAFGSCGIA